MTRYAVDRSGGFCKLGVSVPRPFSRFDERVGIGISGKAPVEVDAGEPVRIKARRARDRELRVPEQRRRVDILIVVGLRIVGKGQAVHVGEDPGGSERSDHALRQDEQIGVVHIRGVGSLCVGEHIRNAHRVRDDLSIEFFLHSANRERSRGYDLAFGLAGGTDELGRDGGRDYDARRAEIALRERIETLFGLGSEIARRRCLDRLGRRRCCRGSAGGLDGVGRVLALIVENYKSAGGLRYADGCAESRRYQSRGCPMFHLIDLLSGGLGFICRTSFQILTFYKFALP